MVRWQYTIQLADLHAASKRGELTPAELGKAVAARIRASKVYKTHHEWALQDITDGFDDVQDLEEYDEVLADLYDWGDENHTCWIDTYGIKQA